ncbi:Immunoglobulin [Gryllus bimaculatus]|nr:Immunoglobulin [Gryllus bimaculatus]
MCSWGRVEELIDLRWERLRGGGLCAAQEHFFFKRAPAAQTVVAGQPARLQCLASRAQGLQYHWQLDGARLRNSTRVQQVGPDLLIRRVDPMRDGGDFTSSREAKAPRNGWEALQRDGRNSGLRGGRQGKGFVVQYLEKRKATG